MNYSGIIKDDIANGIGIRTSLFVSGCRNNCPGCFNKAQQDFNYGKLFTEDIMNEIIDSVRFNYYNGISILGGEPMEPENAKVVLDFVNRFRLKYANTKTIWLYTGYLYEDLIKTKDSRNLLLKQIDVLVDGPFIESKKDITLKFRGSSNQRIINIPDTLKENKVILLY